MNSAQIETALNRAIAKFVACDKHLLAGTPARSMSHGIAVYLEHERTGDDVDGADHVMGST